LNAAPNSITNCPAGTHWINVPFTLSSTPQTTAVDKGKIAVDGVGEMGVSCTVKDAGGVFNVSGTLKSPAVDQAGNRLPTSTVVTFRTTIAPGQAGAQGELTVQDYKTTSTYSSTSCLFSVQPVQPTDQLGVAPGRMWARVTCPMFTDPLNSDAMAVCQIDPGYIVLENCAQ
jgi:hypothetical protein